MAQTPVVAERLEKDPSRRAAYGTIDCLCARCGRNSSTHAMSVLRPGNLTRRKVEEVKAAARIPARDGAAPTGMFGALVAVLEGKEYRFVAFSGAAGNTVLRRVAGSGGWVVPATGDFPGSTVGKKDVPNRRFIDIYGRDFQLPEGLIDKPLERSCAAMRLLFALGQKYRELGPVRSGQRRKYSSIELYEEDLNVKGYRTFSGDDQFGSASCADCHIRIPYMLCSGPSVD